MCTALAYKIEEFSPMLHQIKGPHNILVKNLSQLHCLVTPAQIAEGKKLVEPAIISIDEEVKAYFLNTKSTLVFATTSSGNELHVTSTYQKVITPIKID
jgi:hypothetical protein